jgi:hypothetical protein
MDFRDGLIADIPEGAETATTASRCAEAQTPTRGFSRSPRLSVVVNSTGFQPVAV